MKTLLKNNSSSKSMVFIFQIFFMVQKKNKGENILYSQLVNNQIIKPYGGFVNKTLLK